MSLESRSFDTVIKHFKDATVLGLSLPNKLWLKVINHWQGIQPTQITHVYYSMYIDDIPQLVAASFNNNDDIEAYMGESSDEANRTLLEGLVAMEGIDGLYGYALDDAADMFYTHHHLVDGAYRDEAGNYHDVLGNDVDERVNPMVKDAISRHLASGDYSSQKGVLTVDQGDTLIEQRVLDRLGVVDYTYRVIPYYGNNVILFIGCEQ
jgi:hypothetical protein